MIVCTLHLFLLHSVSIKNVPLLFFNNFVKHWPFLIIFGIHHLKDTWRKWLWSSPLHLNTVATLPCEI